MVSHRILLNLTSTDETEDTGSIVNETVTDVVGKPMILGLFTLLFSMVFFNLAIHYEWTDDLAPRCANRPKAVIKNAILASLPEKYRSNPFIYPIAFIVWSYKLTYKDLINGIPGTGTRNDGWRGPLLKTNVDAVILLKFHTLLFKISMLVACLCMFIIIPVNMTATCDVVVFGHGTCKALDQNTDFVRTTVANIPNKFYNNDSSQVLENRVDSNTLLNFAVDIITNQSNLEELSANQTISNGTAVNASSAGIENLAGTLWVKGQSWRITAILLCCLLIYAYTFYLLTREWIENVALRRAFFLEASLYGQRMIELNKLDFDFVSKKKKDDDYDVLPNENHYLRDECEDLPPYIMHPEIRETPPSIGMYSVLFQLPNSMITYDTNGATALERQLVATAKFFDEIVPPQPGFSSSVVAVTMIPKAQLVARAWTKWNACEKKLQSLRYIRHLREKSGKEGIGQFEQKTKTMSQLAERNEKMNAIYENLENPSTDESEIRQSIEITRLNSVNDGTNGFSNGSSVGADRISKVPETTTQLDPVPSTRTETFKYENFDVRKYAKSLGFSDEVDRMSDFVDGMDIEEFSVFVSHTARLASGPACNQKILSMYKEDFLEEEEKEIIEELRELQEELAMARANVVKLDDSEILVGSDSPGLNSVPSLDDLKNSSNCNMFDSVMANGEWNISESGYEDTLRILEHNPKSKREGKFKRFKKIAARIFLGPDYMDMDPKYYGYEKDNPGAAFVTDIKYPSYAVVTFTSRHAAIIARQCLADGRPTNNWQPVDDIPIYPLADAPPTLLFPMGIMRPVTPTISYYSKKIRRWIVCSFLVLFPCLYIVPVNLINQYIWNPEYYEVIGIKKDWFKTIKPTLSGLTQSLIFCICPIIFKCVANKEGAASSMAKAETRAMIYFWYFYIIARFMGPLVLETFQQFLSGDFSSVEQLLFDAGLALTRQVPTFTAPFALSYIIFISTISFPMLYFLQLNNFLCTIFRLHWINRLLKGGGSGSEVPYRIYVDSGYVLASMMALGPLCPLIGPFALLYFILLSPMLRWLMIFAYRPRFDGGGDKWPKLHHFIITSLLLGQIITMFCFLLKGNIIEGFIIGSCFILTLIFNSIIVEKFLRPFQDASLSKTGKMYVNHRDQGESWQDREEFRRWLIDCHKASYLPTCLSGGKKNLITAEPAMVTPKMKYSGPVEGDTASLRTLFTRQKTQKGGIMRGGRYGV